MRPFFIGIPSLLSKPNVHRSAWQRYISGSWYQRPSDECRHKLLVRGFSITTKPCFDRWKTTPSQSIQFNQLLLLVPTTSTLLWVDVRTGKSAPVGARGCHPDHPWTMLVDVAEDICQQHIVDCQVEDHEVVEHRDVCLRRHLISCNAQRKSPGNPLSASQNFLNSRMADGHVWWRRWRAGLPRHFLSPRTQGHGEYHQNFRQLAKLVCGDPLGLLPQAHTIPLRLLLSKTCPFLWIHLLTVRAGDILSNLEVVAACILLNHQVIMGSLGWVNSCLLLRDVVIHSNLEPSIATLESEKLSPSSM